MSEIRTPEQRALQARQSYMDIGADTPLAHVPAIDLQALCSDVEGVRLPAYAAYDVGWLELETALSTYKEHQGGDWSKHYAPLTLVDRARDRWEKIYLNQANGPEFRSRAEVAVGSLAIYELLVSDKEVLKKDPLDERLVSAANTLLRAYDRHQNPDFLHDLHMQTFMLLFSHRFHQGNALAIPAPSRVQDLSNEKGFDMLLSVQRSDRYSHHHLRIAAQSGGAFGDSITIPPEMLGNQGYEPRLGQGTLRAVLEQMIGKKRRLAGARQAHLDRVYTDVYISMADQLLSTRGLSFEVNPMDGLDEARQWYEELDSSYRFVPADKPALEECINAHEYALGSEKLAPEDAYRLGWLWIELSSLPGESAGFDRAEQVFELSAETAEAQGDWPAYVASRLGIATTQLYKNVLVDTVDPEALVSYRRQLTDIAADMLAGFEAIGQESEHLPRLQVLARNLTTALLVHADEESSCIGSFPSPRQAANESSDVHITAETNDTYRLLAPGKLRFNKIDNNSMDRGIATITPKMLENQGWTDDLAVLRLLVDKNRAQDEYDPAERDAYLDYLRTWIINVTAPTQSI